MGALPGEATLINFLFAFLLSGVPEMKMTELANNVDLDEVAQNEPPHLDLHCLPSSNML